jgi:glucose-6-phosphate-specific signal transduction histidine kinase
MEVKFSKGPRAVLSAVMLGVRFVARRASAIAKAPRPVLTAAAAVAIALLESAAPAFAGSTGLAAMDSGSSTAVTFLGGLAGMATLALIGLGIWDFVQHKNFIRAGFELVAVVACGIVATHATETAAMFGISGALV